MALSSASWARSAGATYAVGTHPYQTVVADFDGDGHPDLATADFGGAQVSVLLNAGDGTFGTASALAVSGSPRSLATGDLDGDGVRDLAVANSSGGQVDVFRGTC
ncbi:FG-GAP repeat domain-containing protein [Streptomyces sp. NPDC086549]|uniref:FG-GAP repeat domain-containing protein n=1 Tax=Streptomyces sp. NPDC086549 TaxID=3365752 RepID=UPI0037F4389B